MFKLEQRQWKMYNTANLYIGPLLISMQTTIGKFWPSIIVLVTIRWAWSVGMDTYE